VLFLGEWCKLYERRDVWSKYNYEVVPYHWNDRDKLYKDYNYLEKLYENLIKDLIHALNSFHRVNKSDRYWTILVGFWLGWFLQLLYDRWFMLKAVTNRYENLKCIIYKKSYPIETPKTISQFMEFAKHDNWNEFIYGTLIENYFKDKISVEKKINYYPSEKKFFNKINFNRKLNIYINDLLDISLEDKYFFKHTRLPILEDFRLQASFHQIPKHRLGKEEAFYVADAEIRKSFKINQRYSGDEFSNLAYQFVEKLLPTIYLEAYNNMSSFVCKSDWPEQPKAIFTSNSFMSEEYFKFWIGEKIENGSQLIIGQHGGNFGMSKFSFIDKYQYNICDKWLSWGWESSEEKKIHPLGNIICMNKKVKFSHNGNCLHILNSFPRYSYHLQSVPVSSAQVGKYISDQKSFLSNLPSKIINDLKIRDYNVDYGYNYKQQLLDLNKKFKFDNNKSILKSYKNSRLVIITSNTTSLLETLYWNIPTICFWDKNHWELNKNSKTLFDGLKDAGIIFYCPYQAAKKVSDIWDNIQKWWLAENVQKSVKTFCNNYSKKIHDIKKIKRVITS
jgi:putative transferase (TIGR04331 family)